MTPERKPCPGGGLCCNRDELSRVMFPCSEATVEAIKAAREATKEKDAEIAAERKEWARQVKRARAAEADRDRLQRELDYVKGVSSRRKDLLLKTARERNEAKAMLSLNGIPMTALLASAESERDAYREALQELRDALYEDVRSTGRLWGTKETAAMLKVYAILRGQSGGETPTPATPKEKPMSVNKRPNMELIHKLMDQALAAANATGSRFGPFWLTHDEIDAWRCQFDGNPMPVGMLCFRGVPIKELPDESPPSSEKGSGPATVQDLAASASEEKPVAKELPVRTEGLQWEKASEPKCPQCFGAGVIVTGWVRHDTRGVHDDRQTVPCPKCLAKKTEPPKAIPSPLPVSLSRREMDVVLAKAAESDLSPVRVVLDWMRFGQSVEAAAKGRTLYADGEELFPLQIKHTPPTSPSSEKASDGVIINSDGCIRSASTGGEKASEPATAENGWAFACQWYKEEEIKHALERKRDTDSEIPADIHSAEFAKWLTLQYRLAMAKGIQIGQGQAPPKATPSPLPDDLLDRCANAVNEAINQDMHDNFNGGGPWSMGKQTQKNRDIALAVLEVAGIRTAASHLPDPNRGKVVWEAGDTPERLEKGGDREGKRPWHALPQCMRDYANESYDAATSSENKELQAEIVNIRAEHEVLRAVADDEQRRADALADRLTAVMAERDKLKDEAFRRAKTHADAWVNAIRERDRLRVDNEKLAELATERDRLSHQYGEMKACRDTAIRERDEARETARVYEQSAANAQRKLQTLEDASNGKYWVWSEGDARLQSLAPVLVDAVSMQSIIAHRDTFKRERDEARAEVERLKAADAKRIEALKAIEPHSIHEFFATEELLVQAQEDRTRLTTRLEQAEGLIRDTLPRFTELKNCRERVLGKSWAEDFADVQGRLAAFLEPAKETQP